MASRRGPSALLAVLAAAMAVAATAQSTQLLIVRGGGSGNGVGMSQWGAEGYALHGWDYRRILAHYYPHTSFTSVPDVPVRVLLLDGRPAVSLSSTEPFLLVDARGLRVHVPAGT